jgi:uncharacterized protein Yka (UPF0111/DUF47 family)
MSGYFGTPDDLTDDMSDEVKRIADGVLPGNREQMAETMKAYADALAKMAAAFEEFARRVVEQLQPMLAALEKLGHTLDRRHRGRWRQSLHRRTATSQTVRVFDRKGRAHWRPVAS